MLGWYICLIATCGTFYMAGETLRAPGALSLVVICDLVLMQCILGRRPCGRLLPSTTRRSSPAECNSAFLEVERCALTFLYGGRDARYPRGPSSGDYKSVGK